MNVFAQTKDKEKFKFAVIGCAHMGSYYAEDYELTIEKINKQNPDFVILLGGMIEPSSDEPIDSLQQKFETITGKLKAPVYNVAGDCTLKTNPVPQEKLLWLKQNFLQKNKNTYYSFKYKNSLFIILDSDSILDTKTNNDQLDFLGKTMADVSKYENIFIFLNKSLWLDTEKSGKWLSTLLPIISNKANFVFGAGKHYLDFKESSGIKYISTTATAYYQMQIERSNFSHFLVAEVNQKNISVKVIPTEGIPIESLTGHDKDHKILENSQKPSQILSETLESPERITLLQPDRIVGALNIKPGMNILDIGAGSGLFSFRFAKTLEGTGHIFAAETNPRLVDYINKTAAQACLNNISGILVQSKNVDNFIKQRVFDRIFLCEVYHYFAFPKDYFKELKESLKKDTGRLYIIHFKNVPEFSKVEFGDFTYIMQILNAETKDFPISLMFSKTVREFIPVWQEGKEVPAIIQDRIIEGLNNMLSNRWLFGSLSAYYTVKENSTNSIKLSAIIKTNNKKLFSWLFAELDNNKVFRKEKKNISETDMIKLKRLNRLLLTDFFKSDVLYSLTSQQTYLWKNSIIKTLEESGFQYLQDHDILTYHHFLEFKKK